MGRYESARVLRARLYESGRRKRRYRGFGCPNEHPRVLRVRGSYARTVRNANFGVTRFGAGRFDSGRGPAMQCKKTGCTNAVTERGYCSYNCKEAANHAMQHNRQRIIQNTR